ncbi:MAG: hypothetical protein AB8B61_04230 [Cyclobacteriaceae bacterium]
MKKSIKVLITVLAGLVLLAIFFFVRTNEPLPKGEKGTRADALATKLLQAVNAEAYDTTRYLEWHFRGIHHYQWDKKLHEVRLNWDNNAVTLYPNSPERNQVYQGGKELYEEKKKELIDKATDFFNNDSFWLVAPYKVFDEGVERRLVVHEGREALLVTYTGGGSTPGDSYLWILDSTGLPERFKMWVSIIPIDGVEGTWEGWKTTESGAILSSKHKLFGLTLDMGEIKAYN